MMGKIFYIMGKSSSGKDTIYNMIKNDKNLNLKSIILYTTRPIRAGEVNGVEYFFTDEEELDKSRNSGNLIEVRSYNTLHGEWKYATVNDEQIDLDRNCYIAIGTLVSYEKIKLFFGEDKVVPIYIEVDDGIRLQRALDREKRQEEPKYAEMCRRFLADAEDFSDEKIRLAHINKRFYNIDLDACFGEIVEYVQNAIIEKKW